MKAFLALGVLVSFSTFILADQRASSALVDRNAEPYQGYESLAARDALGDEEDLDHLSARSEDHVLGKREEVIADLAAIQAVSYLLH
ncbi:hypothetical protein MMC34_000838 [Xylographa carneopallida]|nr:hypothetical protein [Xylographa carneopallida]